MELLMSLQQHIRQLKPRNESHVNHVDRIQTLIRELTISPFYQQKGTFNPYYSMDNKFVSSVESEFPEKDYDELLFKSLKSIKN